jgi:prevent-host-death family protein
MDVGRVGASEAREDFASIINRAAYGGERVIVERRGKALAAVISIEDLRLLELLVEREEDRLDLEESRRILEEDEERIPWAKVKRSRGL